MSVNCVFGLGLNASVFNRTYAALTAGGVSNPACNASDIRYYGKMRKSCLIYLRVKSISERIAEKVEA